METADFGHPKAVRDQGDQFPVGLAIDRRRPSCACHMPPSNSSSTLRRAFGFTLTEIVLAPLIRTAIPGGLTNGRGLAEFLRQVLEMFVHVFRLAEDPAS